MIKQLVSLLVMIMPMLGLGADQALSIDGAKIVTGEAAVQFARESEAVKASGGFIYPGENPAASIRQLNTAIAGFGAEGEYIWELPIPHKAWGIQVVVLINPVSEQLHYEYMPWIESTRFQTVRSLRDAAANIYRNARGADRTVDEGVHEIAVRTLKKDIPGFANKGEQVWEIRVLSLAKLEICSVFLLHPVEDRSYFEYAPWDAKAGE